MPFKAVLDTCVLYPAHLRDTLLRLAERGLYLPLWSEDILNELTDNLNERIEPESVERLSVEMHRSFPEAEVTGYKPLIESMECDPKDRHVLATAVRAEAGALVTFNIRDFPETSTRHGMVEVIHPSDFLLDLLDLAPNTVIKELQIQVETNRSHPRTLMSLLDVLNRSGVETFTAEVRRRVIE